MTATKQPSAQPVLIDANAVGASVGLSGFVILKYAREGLIPSVRISKRIVRFELAAVVEAMRNLSHGQ